MSMDQTEIKVGYVSTKSVMTKSKAPLGGFAVNPYVGCPHACKYCYASFMKRFTGHTEEWGTFMDVKEWPEIKNPRKYAGQKVIIGTFTDGYNPLEETYGRTRRILEELKDSEADSRRPSWTISLISMLTCFPYMKKSTTKRTGPTLRDWRKKRRKSLKNTAAGLWIMKRLMKGLPRAIRQS